MKNTFFGALIAAGALAATPALAQEMTPGTPESPTTEAPGTPMNDAPMTETPTLYAPATGPGRSAVSVIQSYNDILI